MANEKTLLTRIVNKHDTYEAWKTSSLVLKAGEIALASIPTEVKANDGTITIRPTYLMKVGDGNKTFSQLNWLSAPASDVYTWAKAATAEAVEVTAASTTTKKTLANWFKSLVDKDTELNSAITDLQTAVGTGGSVADAISAAITAAIEGLDVSDAAVVGQFVTAVTEADGKISVTRASLKASDIPTLEISKITGLQAALDAKATTTALNTAKSELEASIAAEASRATSAESTLSGRLDTIETWKNTISNVMDFVGVVDALPESVEGYHKGDVILISPAGGANAGKEFVNVGTHWEEFGIGSANEAAISALQARMQTAETNISGNTSDIAENAAAIASNLGKITAVETSLTEAGTVGAKIKAAKDAADAAQSEVDALEGVVDTLTSTVAANKSAIETRASGIEGNVTALGTRIGRYDAFFGVDSTNTNCFDNVVLVFDCGGADE